MLWASLTNLASTWFFGSAVHPLMAILVDGIEVEEQTTLSLWHSGGVKA